MKAFYGINCRHLTVVTNVIVIEFKFLSFRITIDFIHLLTFELLKILRHKRNKITYVNQKKTT